MSPKVCQVVNAHMLIRVGEDGGFDVRERRR